MAGSVFMQRFRFVFGTVQTNWDSVNVFLLFWAKTPTHVDQFLFVNRLCFFPLAANSLIADQTIVPDQEMK